jgi:hypothetical protein
MAHVVRIAPSIESLNQGLDWDRQVSLESLPVRPLPLQQMAQYLFQFTSTARRSGINELVIPLPTVLVHVFCEYGRIYRVYMIENVS